MHSFTPACCAGGQAGQRAAESTEASLQAAGVEQEQAGSQQAAPTGIAAGSIAHTAAPAASGSSSTGGRYQSVPPSSLWGPPAGVTISPAGAQMAGADSQQLPSTSREGNNVPEEVLQSELESEEASMQHRQTPSSQQDSEGQTGAQQPLEEDASMAATQLELGRAQQAQQEALQAEQASLQSSRDALSGVREAMQQQQQQQQQGTGMSQEQNQDQDRDYSGSRVPGQERYESEGQAGGHGEEGRQDSNVEQQHSSLTGNTGLPIVCSASGQAALRSARLCPAVAAHPGVLLDLNLNPQAVRCFTVTTLHSSDIIVLYTSLSICKRMR